MFTNSITEINLTEGYFCLDSNIEVTYFDENVIKKIEEKKIKDTNHEHLDW